jgi:hypothetical protein
MALENIAVAAVATVFADLMFINEVHSFFSATFTLSYYFSSYIQYTRNNSLDPISGSSLVVADDQVKESG